MYDTSSSGLELTPNLTEYAKAVALKVAQRSCPPHVDFEDAVQEAMLSLMSALPKYDASKKAAPKTFIHLVVQRAVANTPIASIESSSRSAHSAQLRARTPDPQRSRSRRIDACLGGGHLTTTLGPRGWMKPSNSSTTKTAGSCAACLSSTPGIVAKWRAAWASARERFAIA